MNYQDEFFTPDEVDEQIKRVSQLKEGEQADSEALAYLRNFYRANAQQERGALDRIWNRITSAAPSLQPAQHEPEKGKISPMKVQQPRYDPQPLPKKRPSLVQRLGVLAAAVFLVILVGSLAIVFYSVRHQPNSPGSGAPTPTPTSAHHSTPTTTSVALQVVSVDMAVNPTSIAGLQCGTNLTVTYTATFHVVPKSAGGTVQFQYTVNGGHGSNPGSVTFAPGETTKTYTFTSSGALPLDHTFPGQGGVIVTSPNSVNSPLLGPTGACSPAAFKVTGVTMAVSPTTIAGMSCGTNVTVAYTATFHVAPGSNGGTVQFQYTVNNGRGSNPGSVTFAPGVTTMTYSFTWSGALPADHTYPEQGIVQVTSPNALTSAAIKPAGQCS
jgi:hypothetical protein